MRRKCTIAAKVLTICCVGFASLFFAGTARSEFPDKPITILVSFDAGSTTDILARALGIGAENLSTHALFTKIKVVAVGL